jgi:foldase protein PrsA
MIPRHTRPVAAVLASLLVLVAIAATGCTTTSTSSTAIATVNGVEIAKSAVDTQIAQMKKASPTSFEGTAGATVEKQYRAQVLEGLIQAELIKEAAKKLGVSITTKQIDNYVAQLQTQYGGKAALQTAMTSAGFTMATLRTQISSNLLSNAVSEKVTTGTVNVTAAEIKAYYTKNKSSYSTPAQVRASHILIAATDTVLAKKLYKQVKNGADIATLAKKYSTDPGSKSSGGDLGWAAPTSYVTEFATAVQAMKVGEVRLVKTQYGWHIIKLTGRRKASQQTLAQATAAVKSTLEANARTTAFTAYVANLEKKATIKILDSTLKSIIDANNALSSSTTTTTK